MIDFSINNQGDLYLANFDNLSKFKFRVLFHVSKYPVFKLSFLQGKENNLEYSNSAFTLKFRTSNQIINKDLTNKAVISDEEIRQRIKILLRTEKDELLNKEGFGSQVYLYKHEDLLADSTIQGIQDTIEDELKNILDLSGDNKLEVKAIPKKANGAFYCQNINVYIIYNDELLYEFTL